MAEKSDRCPRWIKWALGLSLALNLLVVGFIIGAILRGPPERVGATPALWHYGHALPDPNRRELARALRESRGEWTGSRQALRGQRAALAEAVRATPFDISAVEGVLRREIQLAGELADRGVVHLLEQIERMTPEERAAYADALGRKRGGRDRER